MFALADPLDSRMYILSLVGDSIMFVMVPIAAASAEGNSVEISTEAANVGFAGTVSELTVHASEVQY